MLTKDHWGSTRESKASVEETQFPHWDAVAFTKARNGIGTGGYLGVMEAALASRDARL